MRRCSRKPASTKRSKNQVVWARCHLLGLASAMLCSMASSALRGRQLHAAVPHTCVLAGEIALRGSDGGGYAVHAGSIGAGG